MTSSLGATSTSHGRPRKQDARILHLDDRSQWLAWKTAEILFSLLLNKQLRRRWLLEHKHAQSTPVSQSLRSIALLEPIPTAAGWSKSKGTSAAEMEALKYRVRLLRARAEKGKELVAEMERRIQRGDLPDPTSFCHSCIAVDDRAVFLTKCGHRVCLTCVRYILYLGDGRLGHGDGDISVCRSLQTT
ncbi:hypothetical protein Asppvi_002112 [Aspergillus pseudoviridinutans]|uniref:Zinc finger C3HC4 RING-type domain-containing protein n=1 Tax=Aspergillus pseudoviridinutans TaxID=1517512 RepID=A0A9P3B5R5_9EURO|nr:uncharacterized protein Asppvi_002112 [Aspergillus pseudoviridinutans]GIJ83293.1 hypothetical protein Asppvi_002112 [Aspergillus pseudoviridinutans]